MPIRCPVCPITAAGLTCMQTQLVGSHTHAFTINNGPVQAGNTSPDMLRMYVVGNVPTRTIHHTTCSSSFLRRSCRCFAHVPHSSRACTSSCLPRLALVSSPLLPLMLCRASSFRVLLLCTCEARIRKRTTESIPGTETCTSNKQQRRLATQAHDTEARKRSVQHMDMCSTSALTCDRLHRRTRRMRLPIVCVYVFTCCCMLLCCCMCRCTG